MRIMALETSVTQEKDSYKEFLREKIKVTNSMQIFCKYLLDNALNYGRFYYPSLNTFKYDNNLCLSSRTIDRLAPSLVEKNILIKLPRSKSQSYQIDLNNSLFRSVLAIYQPSFSTYFDNKLKKTETKRIGELQHGKRDLEEIIHRLEFIGVYLLELHKGLLDELEENNGVVNKSNDDLIESLRSIIIGYSYNITVNKLSIINEFLQEDERD